MTEIKRINTSPASVEANIESLDGLVQKSGWAGEVDLRTNWYVDALSAASLLLLGREVEYVTGKWHQREQKGLLLLFAGRVIVKVEISRAELKDAERPTAIKYPEALVSLVPRGRILAARAATPLNHSIRWPRAADARYEGWPGAVTVSVDFGGGNEWTLPLEGPPRNPQERDAFVAFLPSLLADMDAAPTGAA